MEIGNIYCVDDDKYILTLYQAILKQAGHQVTKIPTGKQALEKIYAKNPDLIILDEKMNDISGMEICDKLRQDQMLPYIPIIMVTGIDSKEGKIQSLERGIDDYILKPFDHEELLAKVQVMLRIKRLYTDLLRMRKDLIRAERMAAIGQLAAAMAHEIRNPLSIIGGSIQLLKDKRDNDKEFTQTINVVLKKISAIDGTLRELLSIARPLKMKKEAIILKDSLHELVEFIKDKCLAQKVELKLNLRSDLPLILGDGDNLQKVFLNLFLNALNSMPQGGKLEVNARKHKDTMIKIEVKDQGRGIAPDDIEHIFDPFFSRGGTGLGLFVVKMIIEELNGRIEVETELNKGTNMILYLPCIKSEKKLKLMEKNPDNNNSLK